MAEYINFIYSALNLVERDFHYIPFSFTYNTLTITKDVEVIKKKLLLMSILFLSIITPSAHASAEVLNNSNTVSSEYIDEDRTKDVFKSVDNILTDYMKQKLSMYKVSVVDKDIYKLPNYADMNKRVIGVTNYQVSEILIHSNYSIEDEKRILFHELGHTIDSWDVLDGSQYKCVGKYSGTHEFEEIFKEECDPLVKYSDERYFKSDIREFFAESFAIYMVNPDVVKENAPKLYAFMEKIHELKPVSPGWHLSKYNYWYYLENNNFKTGWLKYKDNWYYLDPATGKMAVSTFVDGYPIAPNGMMVADR